jgi:hypothetical protein
MSPHRMTTCPTWITRGSAIWTHSPYATRLAAPASGSSYVVFTVVEP